MLDLGFLSHKHTQKKWWEKEVKLMKKASAIIEREEWVEKEWQEMGKNEDEAKCELDRALVPSSRERLITLFLSFILFIQNDVIWLRVTSLMLIFFPTSCRFLLFYLRWFWCSTFLGTFFFGLRFFLSLLSSVGVFFSLAGMCNVHSYSVSFQQ